MSGHTDYNSATSSSNSPVSSWSPDHTWTSPSTVPYMKNSGQKMLNARRQAASFENLVAGKCTLGDIMKEFHLNGSESDYTPPDDIWGAQTGLAGMGPASAYLRQKSCPEPQRTPIQRLSKPAEWMSSGEEFTPNLTSTPVQDMNELDLLLDQQRHVLNTLPNSVLFYLLHELEITREGYKRGKGKHYNVFQECRFCKNNGERESYYRSHSLKDAAGRVVCPVLRAYVCARCGARGDYAHTAKYCPLTTAEERVNCTAMMRSVRMASGRRRKYLPATSDSSAENYMMFGDTTPSLISDTNAFNSYAVTPLEPKWAALEQKLML